MPKPPDSRKKASPSGSVRWSGSFRKTTGQKKLFQVPWNWRIATAASAGVVSGSITRRKVVKKPAPSTLAASSRSRGIVRKYWRIRKMLVAEMASDEDHGHVLADAAVRPKLLKSR